MAEIKVGGIMVSDGRALLRVQAVPNRIDAPGIIFFNLGKNGINIELMAQTADMDGTSSFSLVVAQSSLSGALTLLQELKAELGAEAVSYVPDVSVVSIFGPPSAGEAQNSGYDVRGHSLHGHPRPGHQHLHLQRLLRPGKQPPEPGSGGVGGNLRRAVQGLQESQGLVRRASRGCFVGPEVVTYS